MEIIVSNSKYTTNRLNKLPPPLLHQIILSVAEHHSNLVPWQLVAQKTGAVLRHVNLTPDNQELDMQVSQ